MSMSLRLDTVHLRVPDVRRSVDFYAQRVGFTLRSSTAEAAELSAMPGGAPLLRLTRCAESRVPHDAAGLFHAALLFPTRGALAQWLRHAARNEVPFDGFSDHGVSEALYCPDADGNGLEFYADRPREAWPFADGEVAMVTRPLDLQGLLEEPAPAAPLLAGARWGHLHLRVTDLERSAEFYAQRLGMGVTQTTYPGARFLAADGYHHHLGLNTWSNPRRSQPAEAPGLAEATFARRGIDVDESLIDPDGIAVRVVPLRQK